MTLKNILKVQRTVSIDSLVLDLDNPRYFDKRNKLKKQKWANEDELQNEISKDGFKDILESIQQHGVLDPVWVVQKSNSPKFSVIEGSRRLVILRDLNSDKSIKPPQGVSYDKVRVNILRDGLTKHDLDALRVILQTKKKGWGPFNVAYVIDMLIEEDNDPKSIAISLGKPKSFVEREAHSFSLFKEYLDHLGLKKNDADPQKYTYFQRAGPAVKDYFFNTKQRKKQYYDLITAKDENTLARIPSVSLKGGLYHFNQFANDVIILEKFLNNPNMTVEDALIMYKGKYVTAKYPWVRKFLEVSDKIQNVDFITLEEFQNNKKILKETKIMYAFCKNVLGIK